MYTGINTYESLCSFAGIKNDFAQMTALHIQQFLSFLSAGVKTHLV